MNIVISNTSAEPIYEQIKGQIRSAIIGDQLAENELLPSIRQLASDLKISVITTARAYTDLEAEGYIATLQGKGSFVLPKNKEHIREKTLLEIETYLTNAITKAKLIKLSDAELRKVLEILLKEKR